MTEYWGIKPVCPQKWSLRLAEGKCYRLCWLTAVVSQTRCNNGCMNWCQKAYLKFVLRKPWSQQNRFPSLKSQVLNEIWFEMLRKYNELPLHILLSWYQPITLHVSSLQDNHPSIKWYDIKCNTSCRFLVLLHAPETYLACKFFELLSQPFTQTQLNTQNTDSLCSPFDITSSPRPMPC